MGWETMSIQSELFWQTSFVSHKMSPLKGRPEILNFQLQQLKAPKQNQNVPSFCYYYKQPGC